MTKRGEYVIIHDANSNVSKSSPVESFAGVAELADARDLKSRDTKVSYRFDPGYRHHRDKSTKKENVKKKKVTEIILFQKREYIFSKKVDK